MPLMMLGISLLLLHFLTGNTSANPGLEFLLTFPQNDHVGDESVVLLTPFYKADSTVQVTITGVDSSYSEIVTLTWGNPKNIYIPKAFQLAEGCHVTGNQTLLIVSTHLITIHVRNMGWSNVDAFITLPTNQLGTQYYAFTYKPAVDNDEIPATFIVVTCASQPTNVTLTLPRMREKVTASTHTIVFNDVKYMPGDVIHVDLDPYEALQIQAAFDLTGTQINSSQPIAVWSGLNRTTIEDVCLSHVIQMLLPTNRFGTEFILVPIPLPVPVNLYRIISADWLTKVTVYQSNDDVQGLTYTLPRPGSYVTHTSTSGIVFEYLESTKPVSVARYMASKHGDLGDAAMNVLMPFGSVNKTYYRFGVKMIADRLALYTLITPKTSLDFLTLNTEPIRDVSGQTFDVIPSEFNVTVKDDLIALVLQINFTVYLNKFVIEGPTGSILHLYADFIGVCEAESYSVINADISPAETPLVESSHRECLELDQGNSTTLFFKESYNTDGCCIKNNQICQCKITTSDNQCEFLQEYKQASSNITVSAPSSLICRRKCDSRPSCRGVNFAHDLPQTSGNCQLLAGDFLGLVMTDGAWRFMHCFTVSTFILTNCTSE